jgi:hypothetical protein
MRYQHNGSPPTRASFLGLWLLAAGGVLPFVALLCYAHPALDDFSYAQQYRTLGLWESQKQLYIGWTGRYVSSALLSIANPLSYAWLRGQGVAGAAVLLLWWGTLLVLVRELLGAAVSAGLAALGATLVLALCLGQLPSPAEGLYWLAGTYTYTVPSIFTILLLAIWLRYQRAAPSMRAGWGILASGLVLIILGGNEVNGVILLAGLAAIALGTRAHRRLWPLLVAAALGAIIAWGAPGNYARLHLMPSQPPVWQVGLRSLGAAAYCLQAWLGSGVLPLAGLLLASWLYQRAKHWPTLSLHQLTRYPWLLTALLLGLLVLSFVPSYWATGLPIPRRARNADYILFTIGWLLTVYSWVAWWAQRYPVIVWPLPLKQAAWIWLSLALVTDHNPSLRHEQLGTGLSIVGQAYRDWLSGAATTYHQQQIIRYTQLRTHSHAGELLRLDPLSREPFTIFYSDIGADTKLWGNVVYAQYFGWSGVYVAPDNE